MSSLLNPPSPAFHGILTSSLPIKYASTCPSVRLEIAAPEASSRSSSTMVDLSITSPEPLFNPTLAISTIVKFVCSYDGRILPRFPDGKLRYHGGVTRVIAIDRALTFSELLVKMGELCGTSSVRLKCQLPMEDLDALVSITSDEDLANIIEEYDRVTLNPSPPKIRAIIWPIKSRKGISNSSSSSSSSSSAAISSGSAWLKSSTISPAASYSLSPCSPSRSMIAAAAANRCVNRATRPPVYPIIKPYVKIPYYACDETRNPSQMYIVDTGN